jgi:hypothetical protein
MATGDAEPVGGVDDPVEVAEFRARILGEGNLNLGEYDFLEIGPLGQFKVPLIKRQYGAVPEPIFNLSSKIEYDPVKFISFGSITDTRLLTLLDQSRPHVGRGGTPRVTILVNILDRDDNEPWGVRLLECVLYESQGIGTLNASQSDQAAKTEFMCQPRRHDWSFNPLF